jgi:hypothetical protein
MRSKRRTSVYTSITQGATTHNKGEQDQQGQVSKK